MSETGSGIKITGIIQIPGYQKCGDTNNPKVCLTFCINPKNLKIVLIYLIIKSKIQTSGDHSNNNDHFDINSFKFHQTFVLI